MSDIGILDDPLDLAVIVLILGWPVLLGGAVIGGLIGWFIGRHGRPWLGSLAGVVAGLAVGLLGFIAYANEWIGS